MQKDFFMFQYARTRNNNYPGYHTAIDNFNMTKDFVDPMFLAHKTLADLVGEIVLELATSAFLPFDAREYGLALGDAFNQLQAALNKYKFNSMSKLGR